MSGRLIAIGDIHGCLAALNSILAAIKPTAEDTLITLGDYVDRGPDSKGVVDRLIALQDECQLVPLIGNHEEMMLDVVRDGQPPYRWLQYGGVETLDSYRFSGDMEVISKEHRQFFASLRDFYETEGFFFVHANYDPELPLDQQPRQLLRWQKLTDLTPPPHRNGKRGVVGHTHDRAGEIFDIGHLICLDTYCYGGGWLTAMDLHSGTLWQSDLSGEMRKVE
jgi:serine/threonine protein phosphatase 1